MASRKAPLIRGYREVDMGGTPLEELAHRHQDALEADQKSPKTCRHYAWGARQAITDLATLLERPPALADWLDPDLQRRRYRLFAERERSGRWRRATTCCQFRADSGWESFLVREGLMAAGERIMGRAIRRPRDTTPQKAPVSLELLRRIPTLYDQDRYEQLAELVRILTLVDTLVRAEGLCAIRCDEYDRRTGVVRITRPKGGGSRAVQLSRHTQRVVTRYLDLRAARLQQRGAALSGTDPLFATIHERLSWPVTSSDLFCWQSKRESAKIHWRME